MWTHQRNVGLVCTSTVSLGRAGLGGGGQRAVETSTLALPCTHRPVTRYPGGGAILKMLFFRYVDVSFTGIS